MDLQARLPPALAALHNFIRKHDPDDIADFDDVEDPQPGARVGLNTGIPRVGFSHTVPEPAHTVTRHGYTHTRTVIHAVLYGTFGTRCLFSLKYVRYIFICKYN